FWYPVIFRAGGSVKTVPSHQRRQKEHVVVKQHCTPPRHRRHALPKALATPSSTASGKSIQELYSMGPNNKNPGPWDKSLSRPWPLRDLPTGHTDYRLPPRTGHQPRLKVRIRGHTHYR